MIYSIDRKSDKYPDRLRDTIGYIERLKRRMTNEFNHILEEWMQLEDEISQDESLTSVEREEILWRMELQHGIIAEPLMDWLDHKLMVLEEISNDKDN